MSEKTKRVFIYLLPFVLLGTCFYAFHFLSKYFDLKTAYLLGFVFYWMFWCLTIPLILLGKASFLSLFKTPQPIFGINKIRNILLLTVPLVFVYCYEFPKALAYANTIIFVYSLGLSIINGLAEEILWRGTFLKMMGNNSKYYVTFSSFGFAIWHLAPLSIYGNHNPGGEFSFITVSFVLGVLYSLVVKDNKSILLTIVSHILFDFSGLGARIYF